MNSNTFSLVFSSMCIVLNIILGTTVSALKIPLVFMDTIGTIFGAVLFGPVYGVFIGLCSNLIQGFITNPKDIPFALVNMGIGFIVGIVSRKRGFDLPTAIATGLVISIAAPLIGTPIAVWIYGGITGGGLDLIFLWLKETGHSIFTAAFIPRITGNLIDKIASCIIVALLVKNLPASLIRHNKKLKTKKEPALNR